MHEDVEGLAELYLGKAPELIANVRFSHAAIRVISARVGPEVAISAGNEVLPAGFPIQLLRVHISRSQVQDEV